MRDLLADIQEDELAFHVVRSGESRREERDEEYGERREELLHGSVAP